MIRNQGFFISLIGTKVLKILMKHSWKNKKYRKKELEDVLMKRNEDLLPSEAICRELALLCNRVTSALEALMIDPTPGTPGIEDVKVVGSFKKGLFFL